MLKSVLLATLFTTILAQQIQLTNTVTGEFAELGFYNAEEGSFAVNENIEAGSYCLGFNGECVSVAEVRVPLHYELVLNARSTLEPVYHAFLKYNETVDGVVAKLVTDAMGKEPTVEVLKRVTKQYSKNKKDLGQAAFEEDEEIDERSFVMKYWKYIAVGLIILIAGGF